MKNRVHPYLKSLTCLYVEDDDAVRDSFSLLVGRYFKKLLVAKNGEEGVELFRKHSPEIVISDIRMPVMDGIEMVRKIKEISDEVFVLFITAFSDVDYLKKAIDLGVDGYITKPVDKKRLIEKLNRFAGYIKSAKEAKEYAELLKEIFDKQPNPTVLLEEGRIKLKNIAFESLFGEVENILDLFESLGIDLNKSYQELRFERNGVMMTLEVSIQRINDTFVLLSFNDVTEYEEEIFTDPLTVMYNRKIVEKILPQITKEKICIIILDIDDFKKINDTFGHPTGDRVLKYLTSVLRSSLRKEDYIIRWGGEEFLIILKRVEDTDTARKIAENLRIKIEAGRIEGVGHITCSFGVCCLKASDRSEFEKGVAMADEALYRAKRMGKNRVFSCVKEPEI